MINYRIKDCSFSKNPLESGGDFFLLKASTKVNPYPNKKTESKQ